MSQFIILTSIPFQAPGAALHWSAGEGHCAAPGRAERVPLGGRQPAVAPAERAAQGQLHQGPQQLSGCPEDGRGEGEGGHQEGEASRWVM